MIRYLGLAIPLLAVATAAAADPMPATADTMLRAAAAKSDAVLAGTADLAKKSFPKSAREIDTLVKQLRATADRRRQEKLKHLGLLRGWKGHGQVGGSVTSGNTRSTGLAAGLDFSRDGLKWTHAFNASFDYQRDNGVETKSRAFASYQANYRFSDRLYLLGLTSWEANRFSGFDKRVIESLGFGVSLLRTPRMTLSLEGGPAMRQTEFVATRAKDTLAGRAAVNYAWSLMPNLKFSENMSYYNEDRDGTFTSNTALTMGLIGSLSVQASYLAQYESTPVNAAPHRYNSTARTTLVYSF